MSDAFRQRLLNREKLIGSWLQVAHATSAEILASAGFDWIAIDCEHTEVNNDILAQQVRAMAGRGPVPLARVRANDEIAIRQVLDLGIQGVIVPLIHDAPSAQAAVAAAKYPPKGVRGFALTRANDFGLTFDDYVANANDRIAVIAMIESRSGVEHIDAILAVDGIDGAFVGPYDLSGSLGIAGQVDDQRVLDACDRVVHAAAQAGKSAGVHQVDPDPDKIRHHLDAGFNFIAVGMDTIFLRDGARRARQAADD